MSSMKDFVIENGVLKRYVGPGGDVVIPDGVTSINRFAFVGNRRLTNVQIPDSVTSINDNAFVSCESLKRVRIPNNVIIIHNNAFSRCKSLSSVIIGNSVTRIDWNAFDGCGNLKVFEISESLNISESRYPIINKGSFVLVIRHRDGIKLMAYSASFGGNNLYSFVQRGNWSAYDLELINNGPIYKYKLPVRLIGALGRLMDPIELTEENRRLFEDFLSKNIKQLIAFAADMQRPEFVEPLFKLGLINNKNEKRIKPLLKASSYPGIAVLSKRECEEIIPERSKVPEKSEAPKKRRVTKSKQAANKKNTIVGEKVLGFLSSEKCSVKELESFLKRNYAVDTKSLPKVKDCNGNTVESFVIAWLLTAHESIKEHYHGYSYSVTVPAFETPGLRKEAAEVVDLLDSASLQNMLLSLADANLGIVGRSKKMFLAYPICRYADEETMAELTKRAPKWRSSVSGNDAPPLQTFRAAVIYSNTRAAMLFADKYDDLGAYAKLRGTDEDTLRDQYLSDVGLDEHRGKTYDLGNQVVTARLQKDFTFLFELPNGKTAKSLPKKGADEEKYAAAKADFDEIKKSVKKIIKNRFARLFEDFLSGRSRDAAGWQASYLHNPLLRDAASLLVWKQGNNTFTLTDDGAINSAGRPYTFSNEAITVAHPVDMQADDLTAWQKYFTSHGLKQPFAQVWEPVHKAEDIKPDRYKDCMIPYYRFKGQEKHGIGVYDNDFHNWIEISFKDCDAKVERIDAWRHMISPDDRFEVQKFTFKKFTRQVNHIVSYLDRVTVWDRVRKDDLTVGDMLDGFTLAQIMEFISAAQEANATNVLALLLNYKNEHFADYDPMEAFVLE